MPPRFGITLCSSALIMSISCTLLVSINSGCGFDTGLDTTWTPNDCSVVNTCFNMDFSSAISEALLLSFSSYSSRRHWISLVGICVLSLGVKTDVAWDAAVTVAVGVGVVTSLGMGGDFRCATSDQE